MHAKTTNAQELIYHKIKAIEAIFWQIFWHKSLKYIEVTGAILNPVQPSSKARHASNVSLIVHFK
jgi:hypothetical protein